MNRNLQWLAITLVSLGLMQPFCTKAAGSDKLSDSYQRLVREAAQALLKEGNSRFVAGHLKHPNADADRRRETVAEGQHPFATILACSDSREPVELIFDRGVGDVFVVRVAGNIAGISELATIEYGVGHLNTPLLVVMGHSKCGAVTAVVNDAQLHGHLPKLAEKIKPAVAKAKKESTKPEETIPKAIEANIWQVISDIISQSSEVRSLVTTGKLQIVGALYDLETGVVQWLGGHPEEKALIAAAKEAPPEADAHGASAASAASEHAVEPSVQESHLIPAISQLQTNFPPTEPPLKAPVPKNAPELPPRDLPQH